jgi:hypothetical protein
VTSAPIWAEDPEQGHDGGSAILILGSRRGGAFVVDEVLICAETLQGEKAMRAWLAAHEIHGMSANGLTALTTRPGRE